MGKCQVEIQSIKFDISDKDITHVEVIVKWFGDCPLAPGIYKKSFPSRITVLELMEKEVPNYLDWE